MKALSYRPWPAWMEKQQQRQKQIPSFCCEMTNQKNSRKQSAEHRFGQTTPLPQHSMTCTPSGRRRFPTRGDFERTARWGTPAIEADEIGLGDGAGSSSSPGELNRILHGCAIYHRHVASKRIFSSCHLRHRQGDMTMGSDETSSQRHSSSTLTDLRPQQVDE